MINVSFAPQTLAEVAVLATLVKATLGAQHRAQVLAEMARPRNLVAQGPGRTWLTLAQPLSQPQAWEGPSAWLPPAPAPGEYAGQVGNLLAHPEARVVAWGKEDGTTCWVTVTTLPGFTGPTPRTHSKPPLAPPTLRATLAWLGIDIPASLSKGWVEEHLARVEATLKAWGPNLAPSIKGQVRSLAGPSRKEVGAVRRYLKHLGRVCARRQALEAGKARSKARLRDSQYWHSLADAWQAGVGQEETAAKAWAATREAARPRTPAERKRAQREREAAILRGDRERVGNTGPSRAWMEK